MGIWAKVGGQNQDDLGSLEFAMKNRHFGGESSWILAGIARKWQILGVCVCPQILVNKASGDSVLQVLGNKARTKCQIVPVPFLLMCLGQIQAHLRKKAFSLLFLDSQVLFGPPPKSARKGRFPGREATQWARRDILMSRGKNCRETVFVSQLSRNCPHHGGNFERGKKALSCGGERQCGRHFKRHFGRG